VADARRVAVARLKARRSLAQQGQFPLESLELGDPGADLGVPPIDQLGNDLAGCLAGGRCS
jgi:hypothetical protein